MSLLLALLACPTALLLGLLSLFESSIPMSAEYRFAILALSVNKNFGYAVTASGVVLVRTKLQEEDIAALTNVPDLRYSDLTRKRGGYFNSNERPRIENRILG